ncbi:MAG: hypothetical protein WA797_00195 [Acidimicrobiales bacterium]
MAEDFRIVVLCMGNICRSPMAQGMLRALLAERGVPAVVDSAGRLESGRPAARHGVDVLAQRGIDIGGHRSRSSSASILEPAGLVLAMAREHVRDAVSVVPGVWPRAFTLKELVRRGELVGPRRGDETLDAWLEARHEGRERRDLLGESPLDDIADPYGQSRSAFEDLADELDDLTTRLVELLWP